jgi:hypothetical protein
MRGIVPVSAPHCGPAAIELRKCKWQFAYQPRVAREAVCLAKIAALWAVHEVSER